MLSRVNFEKRPTNGLGNGKKRGKYLMPGEIILEEEPFAAIVTEPFVHQICSHCFASKK